MFPALSTHASKSLLQNAREWKEDMGYDVGESVYTTARLSSAERTWFNILAKEKRTTRTTRRDTSLGNKGGKISVTVEDFLRPMSTLSTKDRDREKEGESEG